MDDQRFDYRHQEQFSLLRKSGPLHRPTQSPIKRVPRGLLREQRGRDVQLPTHLYILPRLRSVAIFLYSHHTASWCAQGLHLLSRSETSSVYNFHLSMDGTSILNFYNIRTSGNGHFKK